MLYSLHAATWQTIAMRSPGIALETSLYSLQLAKTHMQQWRPSAAKLDNTFWSLRGKKHEVTAFQHWTRSNPGLWTLIKRNWQALYSLLIYFKNIFLLECREVAAKLSGTLSELRRQRSKPDAYNSWGRTQVRKNLSTGKISKVYKTILYTFMSVGWAASGPQLEYDSWGGENWRWIPDTVQW